MKIYKNKRSWAFKTISLILTFTFAFYNLSYAVPAKDIGAPKEADISSELSLDDIGISIDIGTVESRYVGNSGKIIVHIQDAHCNFEAQNNIYKILAQLNSECGIDTISVEGAEGIVDTAWFKAFPDAEIRKEVATYFMKKGEITGAEFYSITTDFDGTIFGAETRDYYIKNLKAFTKVYPYKDIIEKYFINTRTVANRLKGIIYTPELKELDLKIRAFNDRDLELSDFADFLFKSAAKHGISVDGFKNLDKLMKTLEYEEKIDFDIVDHERSAYIDALSKKMSKEEMTGLVTESIRFKKGHIKSADFYSYLRDLAREWKIPIVQEYPNLFYYYIYTKLYDGIDNKDLFSEIGAIEDLLKKKLFKNELQERLDRYSSTIDMFINLVNIELTNEDYDRFKANMGDFSLEDVVAFISKMSDRYNMNYNVEDVPVQISENIPSMIDFYEIAIKRDAALINNTLNYLKKNNKKVCVLIAGGFHTRGIKDILEAKGISYMVVTPKITKDVETPYIKVLTNQRTSLEDILTESAAMPGVAISSRQDEMMQGAQGELLSPFSRVAGANMLFSGHEKQLERFSAKISDAADDASFAERVKEFITEVGAKAVEVWLKKIKADLAEQYENRSTDIWDEFMKNPESKQVLVDIYLDKLWSELNVDKKITKLEKRTYEVLKKDAVDAFEKQLGDIDKSDKSPGLNAVRINSHDGDYENITPAQHEAINKVIAGLMGQKAYTTEQVRVKYHTEEDGDVEKKLEVIVLKGFREAIDIYNRANKVKIPVDYRVHPGTGRGRSGAAMGKTEKRWERMYISSSDWDILTTDQKIRLANHEYYHIKNANDSEEQVVAALKDDLKDIRDKFADREKLRLEYKESEEIRIQEEIISNAEMMSQSAKMRRGPDIVIITSSSDAQAEYWQKRLTGKDNIYGSGVVVKKDAIVLSVTESNWDGGAGNGLGTLNGYVQAARKAVELGLITVKEGLEGEAHIKELVDSFMQYVSPSRDGEKAKSMFMYHTAGKGTRTLPLPGVEVNSKPNIKLPRMIKVKGSTKPKPLTILESVLIQTSIYAHTREGRLGVFWGDQVIINEQGIHFGGKHHVEIFGQQVHIDESIKDFGILLPIPGADGDIAQRDKLPEDEVRKQVGGKDYVYKSIGSFTISLPFLDSMLKMDDHLKALVSGKGKLDTDPDWWQPLTSTKEEYVAMMRKKGKDFTTAQEQWEKINNLWNDSFVPSNAFKDSGLSRRIGFTDVGEKSLWWDYGQNKSYLRNMQILTSKGPEGVAVRTFFGIKNGKWVIDSELDEVEQRDSIILNSKIKRGKIINSIVIDSDLEEVYAENAVIIGSTVIKLNAVGALVYNVVDVAASLKKGQVLVNIFHPGLGRIPMRTDVGRDGSADWKANAEKGLHVYDNAYTYNEIAKLMNGLTQEKVEAVKQSIIKHLKKYGKNAINQTPTGIMTFANPAVEAQLLSGKRNITLEKARTIIAHRMLTFGDVDEFTAKSYSALFETKTVSESAGQLDSLASLCMEEEGSNLSGIYKKEEKKSNSEKYENKYRRIPAEDRKTVLERTVPLTFGTSGLRALVTEMTDMEVYINTKGFIKFLEERGELSGGQQIVVGGDLRGSTKHIMTAVRKAIDDSGYKIADAGRVPTPTLAYYAMQNGLPSIMVTGSHIPDDRNGIKFTKKSGEVLKTDEEDILKNVKKAREEEYEKSWKKSLFDQAGEFNVQPEFTNGVVEDKNKEAVDLYVQRYLDVFNRKTLKGKKIVLYQHSAVGRDIIKHIFEGLGATVIAPTKSMTIKYKDEETGKEKVETIFMRSDSFVSVDTEKVTNKTRAILRSLSRRFKPDAIISFDGDSDRPLFADENGNFLPGDKLGALTALFLKPDAAAFPISTNDGVIDALNENIKGLDIKQTKIGSPFVVDAMNKSIADGKKRVVSWEANGGFLTGSDFTFKGKTLKALPTRDAVLPILSVLMLSKKEGKKVSDIISSKLPPRFNYADVVDNESKGMQEYTPKMGEEIIKQFIPGDSKLTQVDFSRNRTKITYRDAAFVETIETIDTKSSTVKDNLIAYELLAIKDNIARYFSKNRGFENVTSINFIDGIRITFKNRDIVHLRPSGNSPEFRIYATTDGSEDKAIELVNKTKTIIPDMVESLQHSSGLNAVRLTKTPDKLAEATRKLADNMKQNLPVKHNPLLKTGADGYKWGQKVEESDILDFMGAKTKDKKIALATKLGISKDDVISEKWITAGTIDVGTGKELPIELLRLFGAESKITAKLLASGMPLSLQFHRFDEMIVPLKQGTAYLGLKKNVTKIEFIEALWSGNVEELLNKVTLEPGVPYIIPAGMPHAYGKVLVLETKAVTAAQDKTGTVSFYDRLKYSGNEEKIEEIESVVGKKTTFNALLEGLGLEKDFRKELIERSLVRDGKDVLTLDLKKVQEIVDEIEANGFLNVADPSKLVFSAKVMERFNRGNEYTLMGETDDFETGKYDIKKATSVDMSKTSSNKTHSLFVAEGRVSILNDKGVLVADLKKGEAIRMPKNIIDYNIIAVDSAAVVYTFIDKSIEKKGETVTVPLETGKVTNVLDKKVNAHEIKAVFDGTGITEVMQINDSAALPEILIDSETKKLLRSTVLDIKNGELVIEIDGVVLEDGGKAAVFKEGTRVIITEGRITDTLGRVYSYTDVKKGIRLVKVGHGSVTLEVKYERNTTEDIVYTAGGMVWKNYKEIVSNKYGFIAPKEIYAGGKTRTEQRELDDAMGKGVFNIMSYRSTVVEKSAVLKNIKKQVESAKKRGLIPVLAATNEILTAASEDAGFLEFLKKNNVRIMAPLPLKEKDLEEAQKGKDGWGLTRELEAEAMLQGILKVSSIATRNSLAEDMLRVVRSHTISPVGFDDLYSLLPIGDDKDLPEGILVEERSNLMEWVRFIINRLPRIQTYDPSEQLKQRRKVMWSV